MLWELGSSALAQVPELGRFICLLSDCLSSKIGAHNTNNTTYTS